ncbi:hypothetical protein MANY_51020 [Mycolicibacterium anyangense]|uniref:Uncharacterized protein n=1 Tax=Mycolicibacterium anyangense TaxID=1431246 RepID=A0A6N4WG10_9MYCO|nr:hypothetical protein MANY_51020 [Mycolicibacterium anyangense]
MVVVLLAFVAADHQSADALVGEQGLIHRQVGQISFHRSTFLGVQGLAGLQCIERRRGIARVVGERIWRQAWWKVVAHASTLVSTAGIAPGNTTPSR